MATMSYQKLASLVGKSGIATKLNPATAITSTGLQVGKTISKEMFGYDFVGLMIKLAVFYGVAIIVAKFFELVILGRGAFVWISNLAGWQVPDAQMFPQSLKDLFGENGIKGFKFWDIVKIISILLVTAEFFQYINTQKNLGGKPSPMTIGIFTLIIISLGLITVPELIKRVKATDFNLETLR